MAGYGFGYNNVYDQGPYRNNSGGSGGGWNAGGASQAAGESSPSSSASPSSSKKSSNNQSLRPVTIKQLLNSKKPHTDAEFRIDGSDISQVTFIGAIREIVEKSTNISYMMEDGSGGIEVKKWIEADDTDQQAQKRSEWREGTYVRVIGHLNAFNDRLHVVAYHIRLIKNYNEITYHLLEALYAHLLFTKGLLPSLVSPSNGHGFDQSAYNPQSAPAGAYAGNYFLTLDYYKGNQLQLDIACLINQHGHVQDGIQLHELYSYVKDQLSENQFSDLISVMIGEGHIYTTLDEEHIGLTANAPQ